MAALDSVEALALLARLHAHKNRGYGDAWRKRGELLSIFTNLARKYDRLVVALDQGRRSSDERLLDTAGDLCVYAAKYLTWLAAEHPEAFEKASTLDGEKAADDGSAKPVEWVLGSLEERIGATANTGAVWTSLKASFEPLDSGLTAQAKEGSVMLSPERKVELAWRIAATSATLLLALAAENEDELSKWRAEIEAMG